MRCTYWMFVPPYFTRQELHIRLHWTHFLEWLGTIASCGLAISKEVLLNSIEPLQPCLFLGIQGCWGLLLCGCIVMPIVNNAPRSDNGVYENVHNTFQGFVYSSCSVCWLQHHYFLPCFDVTRLRLDGVELVAVGGDWLPRLRDHDLQCSSRDVFETYGALVRSGN